MASIDESTSAAPLAGKVALVTGASGGIGAAICRTLAERGARLALHYRSKPEAIRRLQSSLPGTGHFEVKADLLDPEQTAALVERVSARADRLDILVNNAGVFERHPPVEVDFDVWQQHWQRTLGLNLLAPAHLCHRAARQMIDQGGGGRIINITSRGAFRGEPDSPAYGASKAGLNSLSQSLAVALAPHGVAVFAVAPGFVETAMVREHLSGEMAEAIRRQSPFGRVARVEDVAYWVGCLADPGAEFASGAIIDVNGASYLRS